MSPLVSIRKPTSTVDSLDSASYDPVNHLNTIFSHPSTLSSASDVHAFILDRHRSLSALLSARQQTQQASDAASAQRIAAAQYTLPALFSHMDSVRARAGAAERDIADMCAEIKRLDGGKRNLTAAMTALKRLQMLAAAYEQLCALGKGRQYGECAQLVAAVVQLVGHFRGYRGIDQIAALHRSVSTAQVELLEQVCDDFEQAWVTGEVATKKNMLQEGCLVMDALGEQARARLIKWYCDTELREYRRVFRGNDEAGSLDNIARRYSWFNRVLKNYDMHHASIFPSHWKMGEMLAVAFCDGTRDDFKAILQRQVKRIDGQSMDVNLLLSCLQETLNFEHTLEKRFAEESRSSVDTEMSREEKHTVGSIISEAFEPYMTLWVESQDKQLEKLIPQYKQQPLRNPEEEFSAQAVMPSSLELFHFYRSSLNQCAKLSTGARLVELSRTFGKYLDQYSQQVLLYSLGDKFGLPGPSLEDLVIILNTADYCFNTCEQLEERIKSRADEELRSEVDLQNQADSFMGVVSASIRLLVKRVESELDLVWKEMRNFPWSKLESVIDQSSYVPEMLRIIKSKAAEILAIPLKGQYSRAFQDQLVDAIAIAYCANIFQCKPVSEVGADQMLLDSYALKKGLLELPVVNAEAGTKPPDAFVRRATVSLNKIDSLLKTLQVRPSPPEALVQAYLIHLQDRSEIHFRRILELKGVRKSEINSLSDLFKAHSLSATYSSLPSSSAFLSGLLASQSSGNSAAQAKDKDKDKEYAINPNSALVKEAAQLGTTIMNAARDGVDRLGSPMSASEIIASLGAVSPQPPDSAGSGSNLNDNLRSFGKFFRREGGGFGRFGRGGGTTPTG